MYKYGDSEIHRSVFAQKTKSDFEDSIAARELGNMSKIVRFLSVTLLVSLTYGQDPCDSYMPIPNNERRYPSFSLVTEVSPINDRELHPEGWYGDPSRKLSTSSPGLFKCGGWFPVWRDESESTPNILKMCIQTSETSTCDQSFNIQAHSCGNFEIYFLIATPIHRATYCFDVHEPVVDPPVYSVKPRISPGIIHESSDTSTHWFQCNVPTPTDDTLLYKTTWYVGGSPFHDFTARQWSDSYEEDTRLTQQILADKGVTKAGFNLHCYVDARYEFSAPSESELSDVFFVGIKIHHWTNNVLRVGESRDIQVQMTVPFGCGSSPFFSADCERDVEVITVSDNSDNTQAVVTGSEACKIAISSSAWSQTLKFTITGQIPNTYDQTSASVHLKLKTLGSIYPPSPFWENYYIDEIPITIVKNTSNLKYKTCRSSNDPNQKTFDRGSFYLSGTGVYTLYEDKADDGQVEIQVETEHCNGISTCTHNCGIAIRAGKTVFEITHCGIPDWSIGYTMCEDDNDGLTVRKQSENRYFIGLHTGTTLDVMLKKRQTRSMTIYWLNISLYPTIRDENKSRALCGTLSSSTTDDYVMRNGATATSRDQFVQSWRVDGGQNLFEHETLRNTLQSSKPLYHFCSCKNKSEIVCSPMEGTKVKIPPNYRIVEKRNKCVVKRKRRNASRQKRTAEGVPITTSSWFNGWNESSALAYCDMMFANSPAVQALKGYDIPGIDIQFSKDNCFNDIKHSGTTLFSAAAVADVRDAAMHEALVNPVLKMQMTDSGSNGAGSPMTIYDVITKQTCEADCSERGQCIEGECLCNDGYGGSDCSVDFSIPPVLLEVGDEGHCDLGAGDCRSSAVFGDIFTIQNDAKCRIEKNVLTSDGRSASTETSSSEVRQETISEVECQIPKHNRNDVVVAFNISVAQAGGIYTNAVTMLAYDSTCVNVNDITMEWTLQEGYCTFEGKCVRHGEMRNCYKCGDDSVMIKDEQCSYFPDGALDSGSSGIRQYPLYGAVIITAMVRYAIWRC